MKDFSDEGAIKRTYIPEIERLLKTELDGVDHVQVFDYRLRSNTPIFQGKVNVADKMQPLLRAQHAHCDQSPAGALGRLQKHLPNDVGFLSQGRMRIINVWKPIYNVVEDQPLAICDAQTVDMDNLIETDLRINARQQTCLSTTGSMRLPRLGPK